MITGDGTTITEAVSNALVDSDISAERDDVDYEEINYEQFTPETIGKPPENRLTADEGAERFEFHELTIYSDAGTLTGYAIKNKLKTYGRTVSVEIHDE